MKSLHLIICFAGIACSTSAASAPINFSCTTPLGRNSEIWQSVAAPAFRVRGRIVPIGLERLPADPLRMDGHDIPAVGRGADVMIGRRSDGSYMTLGVGADLEGRVLTIRLVSEDEGRESDEDIASLDWSPGSQVSIPFEFSVERTKTVVRVYGREFRFGIGSDPHSEVRFGCSGGAFDFYELEISR
jgi:hypothetical protein